MENSMSLEQFADNCTQWANDKGLLIKNNSKAQTCKVMEEVGEVARAVLKNDQPALIDGIGDVMVALAILAAQNGLTLQQCATAAWNEIKNRTGKTVDGTFIKN